MRRRIFFLFALVGWFACPPNAPAQTERPRVNAELPAIIDLNELFNATNRTAFGNRAARFSGVKVLRVLDPPLILIGPDEAHALPVMLDQAHPDLHANSVVNVSGTLQPLGPDLREWSISEQSRKALSHYDVVLTAPKIEVRK